MNNEIEIDLHMHSNYSYDSLAKPKAIFKKAARENLGAISITDHDHLASHEILSKKYGVKALDGCEYKTKFGDITAINNKEFKKSMDVFKLIELLKEEGSLIYFPHPYRSNHGSELTIKDVADQCDLIEVWNPYSTVEQNLKATKLAADLDKQIIVGSDAHFVRDVGAARTKLLNYNPEISLLDQIMKNDRIIVKDIFPKHSKHKTQIIKNYKEHNFKLLIKTIVYLPLIYIRDKRKERMTNDRNHTRTKK